MTDPWDEGYIYLHSFGGILLGKCGSIDLLTWKPQTSTIHVGKYTIFPWIRHGILYQSNESVMGYCCWSFIFCFCWYADMGVSLNGGTPQNTPKWSFLVGKPMVVGYHHFRKPAYGAAWRIDQRNSTWTQPRQWQRDVSRKTHLSLQIFLWKKRGYLQVNLIPILLILTLTLKKKRVITAESLDIMFPKHMLEWNFVSGNSLHVPFRPCWRHGQITAKQHARRIGLDARICLYRNKANLQKVMI